MEEMQPRVNCVACQIIEVRYAFPSLPCDYCQRTAEAVDHAERTAIDLHLDRPILLYITVSLHYCVHCDHYFRAQPPFLRPDAIYTNRVVQKAVQSMFEDGMAKRRVSNRLARDFWVMPSETSVRNWCKAYQAGFNFETDYQPWAIRSFSGILCVDEVYQDDLALLLAVDPAAPQGDRLIGYQLIQGTVDADKMEIFLKHLREVGIIPAEVITDGSSLYPATLKKVWPTAAHQLCLFHETRHVTKAVMEGSRKYAVPYPSLRHPKKGAKAGRWLIIHLAKMPTTPRFSAGISAATSGKRGSTRYTSLRNKAYPSAPLRGRLGCTAERSSNGYRNLLPRRRQRLRQQHPFVCQSIKQHKVKYRTYQKPGLVGKWCIRSGRHCRNTVSCSSSSRSI